MSQRHVAKNGITVVRKETKSRSSCYGENPRQSVGGDVVNSADVPNVICELGHK